MIVDCPDNSQTEQEIGDVFSVQNTAGTPTYYYNDGVTNKSIQRLDSQGLFTTYNYNLVSTEPIYVYVDIVSTVSGFVFDSSYENAIKEAIVNGLGNFRIYGLCNTNSIIKIITDFNSDLVVGTCQLSTTAPSDPTDPTEYTIYTYAQPSNVNKKFTLDVNDIFIQHP